MGDKSNQKELFAEATGFQSALRLPTFDVTDLDSTVKRFHGLVDRLMEEFDETWERFKLDSNPNDEFSVTDYTTAVEAVVRLLDLKVRGSAPTAVPAVYSEGRSRWDYRR